MTSEGRHATGARTEDWRSTAQKLSNWGRWGADDQLGTRNLITGNVTRHAASLVRRGAVFDLGIPLDDTGPQHGDGRINPLRLMSAIDKPSGDYGLLHYNDDYVFMPLQTGSHWDGLSHVYYEDRLYNDVPGSTVTFAGAQRLGIETQAKGVVGRGVLLDVASHVNVEWMAAGQVITASLLDEVAHTQGVAVLPGDVVLIRTGWRRKFLADGDGRAFLSEEPGLGLDACHWLSKHSVAAVASDNWGIEAKPFDSSDQVYPVHMVLIRDMGMLLGEMWDFEELTVDCRNDGMWEFLLTAPVLKFTGAVGSPVNPLAIK